ncbi:hypothetical protein ACWEGE_30425 [Amycolatopsis sp. NPDC004747]
MRHLFRVNVREDGYSLYSYSPAEGLCQLPLDVTSDADSEAYFFTAQRNIDDLLMRRPERLYLAASASANGGRWAVYGCSFQLPDEYGRDGLTFLHGLEGENLEAADLVSAAIKLTSPDVLARTGELIGKLAVGDAVVAELGALFDSVGLSKLPSTSMSGSGGLRVGSVVHDCGGVPLAWLAMAVAQSGEYSSWEIRDTVLDDGRIATVSVPSSGPVVLLSELQLNAVRALAAPADRKSENVEQASVPVTVPSALLTIPQQADLVQLVAVTAGRVTFRGQHGDFSIWPYDLLHFGVNELAIKVVVRSRWGRLLRAAPRILVLLRTAPSSHDEISFLEWLRTNVETPGMSSARIESSRRAGASTPATREGVFAEDSRRSPGCSALLLVATITAMLILLTFVML